MNMNTLNEEWKEIKGNGDKVVKYHIKDQDFVDKILIKEDNNMIEITFEIKRGEPYDILTIQTTNPHNRIIIYLEKGPDTEDPAFTYKEFYENRKPEEVIQDIKSYILDLVSYFLNLS